jgi:hypothetical protein
MLYVKNTTQKKQHPNTVTNIAFLRQHKIITISKNPSWPFESVAIFVLIIVTFPLYWLHLKNIRTTTKKKKKTTTKKTTTTKKL